MGFSARQLDDYFVEWLRIMQEHPEGITYSDLSQIFYERHPEITDKRDRDNLRAALGHIRSNCRKIGWLHLEGGGIGSRVGKWFLTNEGKAKLAKCTDPEELVKEAAGERRKLNESWEIGRVAEGGNLPGVKKEMEVEISAALTFEDAQATAQESIKSYLHSMNEYTFQDVVADLLRAMDFHVNWIAPPGPDGGCDIIAFVDPLGTRIPVVKVQVKRQQAKAPVSVVKAFSANLGQKDVGIFICLGGFTGEAEYFARSCTCQITLIDLERFVELWIANMDKLTDAAKSRFRLEPIYYVRPSEE